jgi:predicted N-acetyltransferase YhbS
VGSTPLDLIDAGAVDHVAALCRRSLDRPPAADELRACLWAPDQPAIVRGDPEVGIVAAVPSDDGGSIRILVVDPAQQGRGHGARLLHAAEQDLAQRTAPGEAVVTVGADPPYHLFSGVETSQLAMLCLLERRHYNRVDATFNMDVDLADLPPDPADQGRQAGPADQAGLVGPVLAGPADRVEVEAYIDGQWPNWRGEVLRALDKGSLAIERDDRGISAFCAWDVNRRGLLGPVAVRLDLIGRGAGVAVLVFALHRMREAGWGRIEVAWVGPVVPYARVGGTVGRVFFVYRKTVAAT